MKMIARVVVPLVLVAGCSPPTDAPPIDEADMAAERIAATGIAARTLPQIVAALQSGEISAEALVQSYLDRIDTIDRAGPTLQSVLSLNLNALEEARELDRRRASGDPLGPLHGVPILLKDNIESRDPMPTTAGSLALRNNLTGRDAPLVARLRAAGAIILGKTNLSQWANFRSTRSTSGWSALGGQVRNPHMLDRSPCGSSSGSGAATAASLAAGSVGTETNGSIICPANANGIVGFKPTVGLVSQQFIVPISFSQDTAGPMTRTVTGAAMLLSAMAEDGYRTGYVEILNERALTGVRVGVLRFAQGSQPGIVQRFDEALGHMTAAGAQLVEIEQFDTGHERYGQSARNVLYYEFKATINEYLASAAPEVKVRSLQQLIAFNRDHAARELALFGQDIFEDAAALGGLDEPQYTESLALVKATAGENGIDAILAQFDVDVLVAPSGPIASRVDPVNGDVWPDWVGAGWMAAAAGYPHLSVPMGTVSGIPVGVSFIGTRNTDAKILAYGFAFEQQSRLRAEPTYIENAEDRPEIAESMRRPRRNGSR